MRYYTAAIGALLLVGGGAVAITPAYGAELSCQGQPATIVATADSEMLQGTEGADVIVVGAFDWVRVDGGGGDDVLCTTAGRGSVLDGGAGDDVLVDQDSASEIEPNTATTLRGGSSGDDRFIGGPDTLLSFADSPAAVTVDLAAGTEGVVTHVGGTDSIAGIHRVVGSDGADTFRGSSGDDYYQSDGSLDSHLVDQVAMGAGDDRVMTSSAMVDLGAGDDTGNALGGTIAGGEGDDHIAVNGRGTALGGPGRDRLATNGYAPHPGALPMRLEGGAGNDILVLPVAYSDDRPAVCPRICARGTLKGGTGTDLLDLSFAQSAVVDLRAGRARTKSGRSTIASVENVRGTPGVDVIRGDGRANRFAGHGGDDVLVGRAGADRLIGGTGRDRALGGPGRDRCRAETKSSC